MLMYRLEGILCIRVYRRARGGRACVALSRTTRRTASVLGDRRLGKIRVFSSEGRMRGRVRPCRRVRHRTRLPGTPARFLSSPEVKVGLFRLFGCADEGHYPWRWSGCKAVRAASVGTEQELISAVSAPVSGLLQMSVNHLE